jgi:radical SAM protein (TIGR01212 family)
MQQSTQEKRYLSFNQHLKDTFGEKVYKVTIDAGFTCPNQDGTQATGGCIYCYRDRSTRQLADSISIQQQIRDGVAALQKRYKANKFLAYFQAYTNTYAPVEELQRLYSIALAEDNIVGLSVGTRPDCVNEPVLDLLESIAKDSYLWVEYGLQSIHDDTLKRINRGHGVAEFLDAVERTQERQGIKICVHVILGLPGETKEDMLETAKKLSELQVEGVKIHSAHILKNTRLEEMCRREEYQVIELPEYVDIVCDFLEYLTPDIVIHRLVGDAPRSRYVAPEWCMHKSEALRQIDLELERRNSYQGKKVHSK